MSRATPVEVSLCVTHTISASAGTVSEEKSNPRPLATSTFSGRFLSSCAVSKEARGKSAVDEVEALLADAILNDALYPLGGGTQKNRWKPSGTLRSFRTDATVRAKSSAKVFPRCEIEQTPLSSASCTYASVSGCTCVGPTVK